jgi:hypothetical protein
MNDLKIWMDGLGWLGAMCFLVSYFFLITKKWKSNSMRYHLSNLFGALFLVANTIYDASFPSVFINGTWAGIALMGMWMDKGKGQELELKKVKPQHTPETSYSTSDKIKVPVS